MSNYFIKLSRKDCHKVGIGRYNKETRSIQDIQLGAAFMRMFRQSRKMKRLLV